MALHVRVQWPAGIWRVNSCFACASCILVQAFGVSQAEADSFDQQHPAPERPSTAKPSPAKTAAGGGGGGSRGRPAKRAKVAQPSESSSDSEEDAEAEEGVEGDEEDGEQQQQQQEEQRGKPRRERQADDQQGGGGLTEMERQRLELIKRNREVGGAPPFVLQPSVCFWTVLPAVGFFSRGASCLKMPAATWAGPILIACSSTSCSSCIVACPKQMQRMMALNLPGMAAELLPAAPAKQQQPAKHKGACSGSSKAS